MPFYSSSKMLQAEISRKAAEACDQIVSELGAEIHDDLIQKLSIFRLFIDRIEQASNDPVEIESLAISMRTEFEQVVLTVKSISRRLLPVRMEGEKLPHIVELLCQNMEVPGKGHIHFISEGEPVELDGQKEMYILRIIQELIQNAFRHSSAWHVFVRMKWTKKSLHIEVEDDGSGFSRVEEFISTLKKKYNTIRMRSMALGASIKYLHGQNGLLAKLRLKI